LQNIVAKMSHRSTSENDRKLQRRLWIADQRAQESEDTKKRRLALDRENTAKQRADESDEARAERLAQVRENTAMQREDESEEARAKRLAQVRENTARQREDESEEARAERLAQVRENTARQREDESEEARAERLAQVRVNAAVRRKEPALKDLAKSYVINDLKEDVIKQCHFAGSIYDICCPSCMAYTWKGEVASFCCCNGMVVIEKVPHQAPGISLEILK
jgi:hypothetical protein